MIYSVICGTNRKDALSLAVARAYQDLLQLRGVTSNLVDLNELPHDFAFSALYENRGKNEAFNRFNDMMVATDKFVFIVPEYNASIPGALKTFIDGLAYPHTFRDKKGALVGLASGGHGASLALSHLTDILNHCGMNTLAFKPHLDQIEQYTRDGVITNSAYMEMLEVQVDQFVRF